MDDLRQSTGHEVPVGPVPGSSGGRRRAGLVLTLGVAVVAIAIGLAAIPPKHEPSLAGPIESPAVARVPSVSPPSSPATASRAPSSRREALLDVPNVPLPGAPNAALVERDGNDARIVAWNPGDTLRLVRTLRGAFTADGGTALLSPDGLKLVVATPDSTDQPTAETVRIVGPDGHTIWEAGGFAISLVVVWSADSRSVAVVSGPRTWRLIGLDRDGSVESDRTIVPGREKAAGKETPSASPSARGSGRSQPDQLSPIGFSQDGRWLFAAPVPLDGGTVGPVVRVSIADGAIESIAGYATSGPLRLATNDGRAIDPTTGRTIRWVPNASIPGGPPIVQVTEADGSLAYRVPIGVLLSAAWDSGGDLIILDADGYPFPSRIRLIVVHPDGTVAQPILSSGPMAFGGLLGVRDGFALLGLGTQQPATATQILAVDLVDGTTSGLTLPAGEARILGVGLLP